MARQQIKLIRRGKTRNRRTQYPTHRQARPCFPPASATPQHKLPIVCQQKGTQMDKHPFSVNRAQICCKLFRLEVSRPLPIRQVPPSSNSSTPLSTRTSRTPTTSSLRGLPSKAQASCKWYLQTGRRPRSPHSHKGTTVPKPSSSLNPS